MAQERDIALGVMQIAASQANGVCTFRRAYAEIPNYVKLSQANVAASITRPGEPMWHQIVRNIKSHDATSSVNFIADGLLIHIPRVGYKLTPPGRTFISNAHP